MATIIPPREGSAADAPPLYNGQRLVQSEFHRLYEACPKHQKFELIDGVVHMAAAQLRPHSRHEFLLASLLGMYEAATYGIEGLHNATTILDERNEPQPDLQLRILPDFGGRTAITADQYVTGPPELIIEISHSSLNYDLRKKSLVYQQQGVKEYIVVDIEAAKLHWFVWPEGESQLDSDDVLRSRTFPGLWIDCPALFREQIAQMLTTLNQGLQHPDHSAFVAKLQSNVQK